MSLIIFSYDGVELPIQCKTNDKLINILNKLSNKITIDFNSINILYSGQLIKDKELTFHQIANESDKKRNIMNMQILDNLPKKEKESYIKSKQIICPECKENIRISIENYKIQLYDCINFHNINNIAIEEYEDTQKINQTNIICDNCNKMNKASSYKNLFYRCNRCKQNLCVMCKNGHNSNHNLINYDDINYICKIHNEPFTFFCKSCNNNICISCENEHNNHEVISFGKIIPNRDNILNKLKEIRNMIDIFNNDISDIINKLKKVNDNIEILYDINNYIFNNYNNNNKSYETLLNMNDIEKNLNLEDISDIIKNNNIFYKFEKIISIYNKMIPIDEIRFIYNIKPFKEKLNIFGNYFVKNNKDKCCLIYEDKKYDLTEFFDTSNIKKDKLELKLKGISNITNMSGMFMGCNELISFGDISNIKDKDINTKCDILTDISQWNTNKVTDMSWLFMGCTSLQSLPNISKWNTNKVHH